MRAALSISASLCLATSLLIGQEPRGPMPPIPGQELPPGAVRIPLGIKEAKPEVPTPEKLIEKSKTTLVEADSLWLTIEHAQRRGMTTIDIFKDGSAHLIERRFLEDGSHGPLIVRSGRTIPPSVAKTLRDLARQRSVIYGTGRDRLSLGAGADRVRFGLEAGNGASVYSSQSAAFDEYPVDVRRATVAVLTEARKLPLSTAAKGLISAEFVDPRQAMRLTTVNGQRLFPVPDPGKTAEKLSPLVAAGRMPGRKIVISDLAQWKQILAYGEAAGGESFLITLGRDRYFRIMSEAVVPAG